MNIDELNELPQAIVNTINNKMKNHITTSINQAIVQLSNPIRAIDILEKSKIEGRFVLQIVAAILETPAADTFNLIRAGKDGVMTLDPRNNGRTLLDQLQVGIGDDSDPNLGEIDITMEADNQENSEAIAYAIRAVLHGGALQNKGLETIDKKNIEPNYQTLHNIGQRLTAFFANDIIKNDKNLIKDIENALK